MNNTQDISKVEAAQELFKEIMNLYWTYIDTLEKVAARIPDSETAALKELAQLMEEIQISMEHDIALFQKASNDDFESLHLLKDQLKIDEIHKKLEKND